MIHLNILLGNYILNWTLFEFNIFVIVDKIYKQFLREDWIYTQISLVH